MPISQMLVLGPISCGQGSRVTWWKTHHPVDDERRASERGHWWVGIAKLLRNACVGCLVLRNKIDGKHESYQLNWQYMFLTRSEVAGIIMVWGGHSSAYSLERKHLRMA